MSSTPSSRMNELFLNETHNKEVIRGQTFMRPRPAPLYLYSTGEIFSMVSLPFRHKKNATGGWWILLEPEIHVGKEILIPDVAGWRKERMPTLSKIAYFPLAPDWVCEILSPSAALIDRSYKLPVYAEQKIPHVWILDPVLRILEVYQLAEEHYTLLQVHTGKKTVRIPPFEAIEIELSHLWLLEEGEKTKEGGEETGKAKKSPKNLINKESY